MQNQNRNNVRYYIVKRDDQPVVRSVTVERPTIAAAARPQPALPERVDGPLSVTSKLRLALRRRHEVDQEA